MSEPKHIVRAAVQAKASRVRHPKNDNSEIWMTRLGDLAGLTRTGVNISRIPPGKEAFVPHAHLYQEEWVYVVSGRGRALIGDEHFPLAPGDFMGFPCDGTVHHLTNDGDEDLVVLQGGERHRGDVGIFPTLGGIGIPMPHEGHMAYIADESIERIPLTAWLDEES